MNDLHTRLEGGLKPLNLVLPGFSPDLPPALLQLRIGGEGSPYLADHRRPSGDYIDAALDRALEIYRRLPEAPDLLLLIRDREDAGSLSLSRLQRLGLPAPEETLAGPDAERFYWTLQEQPPFLRSLFREIIRGELDPMGLDALCGNVFFVSTGLPLLFHLQDDRWAHVAAPAGTALTALQQACGDWVIQARL